MPTYFFGYIFVSISRTQDQMEDTAFHLSSFISSFAKIIEELDSVDETSIEHLERVIGTLFMIFPQLYKPQRKSYYRSMAKLCVALYPKGTSLKVLFSRIGRCSYYVYCLYHN